LAEIDSKTTLTSLLDKFKASVEHETWRNFNKNATNDFEFREGIQWSNTEIEELKRRGQPATVENEIHPIVERIRGQYASRKTRIIFKGRNVSSDESRADTLSALALHAQQQTGYEFEEADMFDDGQICGFGVLEAFITFEKDLSPKINLKAENPLNIFPDPNSKKYDWNEDADYICRAKWLSYNEALKRYPKYKSEMEGFINSNPVVNDSQTMEKNHLIDQRLKRIRIVEVWYKDWVQTRFAIAGGFGVKDITNIKRNELSELKRNFPDLRFHETTEPKMRVGIFCGETLLEDKASPYEHNLFPFVPYFVYRRKNGEPYSYVRLLKDSSMEINKRRSKALHLLNTNQAVFEEGAVADDFELKQEMAKPDGLIKYRKGFKFEINKNIDIAVSQVNLQSESKASIARISGVSDEAMARHSEVRSGIGLQRKQQMTGIIVSPIFSNLRRSRLMIGKLIYELIKQHYTEEKVYNVIDNLGKAKEVTLDAQTIQAIKEGIFDIIIEEAPDVTTIQEEQFMYLAELIKGLGIPPNIGIALLPIMLQLSNLKNKEEIIPMVEKLQQIPPEKPKTSLSLTWSELYPEEKAMFAQLMGLDQLAEFEMQMQREPKQLANKQNPDIEMAKTSADLNMKDEAHKMKMQHGYEAHQMKMGQQNEIFNRKMAMQNQQDMMDSEVENE